MDDPEELHNHVLINLTLLTLWVKRLRFTLCTYEEDKGLGYSLTKTYVNRKHSAVLHLELLEALNIKNWG